MTNGNARWYFKKLARTAVSTIGGGLNHVALDSSIVIIRAITYHRFGNNWPRDPFCVESGAFEAQMRWLALNGLAISHDDLLAFIQGKKKVRSGSVLVTIDDGYSSVMRVAAPILKEYAIPAAIYIATNLIANSRDAVNEPERYMTWEEVQGLHESGFVIGSHSHTHRSLGKISVDEARDELSLSFQLISRNVGVRPVSFAYPYGTPTHYSRATHDAIAAVGYQSGFTSTHGHIQKHSIATQLPRIKIEGGESLKFFQRSCGGSMDHWRFMDHAMCYIRR